MNLRSCKVVQVVEVIVLEGKGVEGDPFREITTYHDFSGNLLARADPVPAQGARPLTVEQALDKCREWRMPDAEAEELAK